MDQHTPVRLYPLFLLPPKTSTLCKLVRSLISLGKSSFSTSYPFTSLVPLPFETSLVSSLPHPPSSPTRLPLPHRYPSTTSEFKVVVSSSPFVPLVDTLFDSHTRPRVKSRDPVEPVQGFEETTRQRRTQLLLLRRERPYDSLCSHEKVH